MNYADEDAPMEGHKFFLLSMVCAKDVEGAEDSGINAVKFRLPPTRQPTFSTLQEAEKAAQQLQQMDPRFHIFVGELGKWLTLMPQVEQIEKQEHADEKLNNLMRNYHENQEKAKIMYERRKKEMLQRAVVGEMRKKKRNKRKRNKNKKLVSSKDIENHIKKRQSEVEELRENLHEDQKEVNEKEGVVQEEENKLKDTKKEIDQIKKLLSTLQEED